MALPHGSSPRGDGVRNLITALLVTWVGAFGWACGKVAHEADRRTDEWRTPPYDWEAE
jgi:hypothetical protein